MYPNEKKKAWVLWRTDGSGVSIERVYLDEERAKEDHDLLIISNPLTADEYRLTEARIYGERQPLVFRAGAGIS